MAAVSSPVPRSPREGATQKDSTGQKLACGPQLSPWEGGTPCSVPAAPWDAKAASVPELLVKLLGPAGDRICEADGAYADLNQLAAVPAAALQALGLSSTAVERVEALFEFAKRFGEREFRLGAAFTGSYDVYAHFRERLATEPVEYFYAVLLDNKHRKLRDVMLSKGSLTASIVHPRDAYLPVIRYSAAAVIFVHNHPSGDPTPSADDLEITRRLQQVGELIGVRVLDHIVVGRGRYVSFVDDGYWTGAPSPALSSSSGRVSDSPVGLRSGEPAAGQPHLPTQMPRVFRALGLVP